MPHAPTTKPLPIDWLNSVFSCKAAQAGRVVRRQARDIEHFAGWELFHAELRRRGFRAVENSGQIVIFCNRDPIKLLTPDL